VQVSFKQIFDKDNSAETGIKLRLARLALICMYLSINSQRMRGRAIFWPIAVRHQYLIYTEENETALKEA
jgi:hypothetical protein